MKTEAPERWEAHDRARRILSGFYLSVLRMVQREYLESEVLSDLAELDGYRLLIQVVEPLEYALGQLERRDYRRDRYDELVGVCGLGGAKRFERST